jgi:glycerophosphoryl diester phosphodiesterase
VTTVGNVRFSALEVVAHRGDFYRSVENTLPALQQAFDAGADAVEFDVQMSRDGVAVLYHDDDMGGAGFSIAGEKKAQLKAAQFDPQDFRQRLSQRAGQPLSPDLKTPPTIPTLDEVLTVLPRDKKVYIELKRPGNWVKMNDGLEEAVVKWIQDNNLQDRAVVISFNVHSLRKVKALAPTLKTGLDIDNKWDRLLFTRPFLKQIKRWLNIDYWLPSMDKTTPRLVKDCHELGMKIIPWIYRANLQQEQKQLAEKAKMGVDGLITNQPGFLKTLLAAK